MVYPTDIPTLGTPGPNLSATGGTGNNKEHDDLHIEQATNLAGVMNELGLPADNSTATVMGRLNNLENYPQVVMLETGVDTFLDTTIGGYLIAAQRSAGTAPKVIIPTGHTYTFLNQQSADSAQLNVSGRELTMSTQSPYPVMITFDPTAGQNFWYVAVLGNSSNDRHETTYTWPLDNQVNTHDIVHNLNTLDVALFARGTFDAPVGTQTTLAMQLPCQPVDVNTCRLRTYDYPDEARYVRNVPYEIVVKRL